MSKLSPLEIYKVLPKTNCRECGAPTCMAFAAQVVKGEKRLADCPHLDSDTIARFEGSSIVESPAEINRKQVLESLIKEIAGMDLSARAESIGGTMRGKELVVKCLGKDFAIAPGGVIDSQCHTHAWFSILLLNYVLQSKGREPSGEWKPFRLLEGGAQQAPLFEQRCEKPLKHLADTHTELFEYLIDIFNARASDNFDSDISVVLYPFPKVPLLVCYWKAEGELDSQLHLFFDSTAGEHLDIDTIFYLGVGIAEMMEKVMLKHK